VENSGSGEVGTETVFHYHQDGGLVWAEYSGGEIVRGTLIAKCSPDGRLDMRYQHYNRKGELMTGRCISTPELLPDGRIRLNEKWQWTSGDLSTGESAIEEAKIVMFRVKHYFFLVSSRNATPKDLRSFFGKSGDASLPDDLIHYIYDSLSWIPSFIPGSKMGPQNGLDLYGVTAIKLDGAVVLKNVFEAWRDVFALGPDVITLTGHFTFETENDRVGDYQKLCVDKAELISDLNGVIRLCDELMDSNEEKLILHTGI
jgi:hypothetical protein